MDQETKRATLRAYGWTETIYKTWLPPGAPWYAKPWHTDIAYRRVTGEKPQVQLCNRCSSD